MKYLIPFLCVSALIFGSKPKPSTTSVVVVVGAVMMSENLTPEQIKYKRKDCTVCKGKGWYMSGDKIKKIECTYCEP